MRLEDHLNEATRLWPLQPDDAIKHICEAITLAAGGAPSILNARQAIIDAFAEDPAWRQTYVDNIACVIMDFDKEMNRPPLIRVPLSHELCNQLAERILNHIFS